MALISRFSLALAAIASFGPAASAADADASSSSSSAFQQHAENTLTSVTSAILEDYADRAVPNGPRFLPSSITPPSVEFLEELDEGNRAIGYGRCLDANGRTYDHITFGSYLVDRNSYDDDASNWCPAKCLEVVTTDDMTHYRGFELLYEDQEGAKVPTCNCLFDDGFLPAANQDGRHLSYYDYTDDFSGVGMVTTSEGDEDSDYECYGNWMDSFYENVGEGECLDVSNEKYDHMYEETYSDELVLYEGGLGLPQALPLYCASICKGGPNRGFEVHYDSDGSKCLCLMDDGEVPQGVRKLFQGGVTNRGGTGPIRRSTGPPGDGETFKMCYKTKLDINFALVGDGICQDASRNRYDSFVVTEVPYGYSAQECAIMCLEANAFAETTDGVRGSLTNFRGFTVEDYGEETLCYCFYDDDILDNFGEVTPLTTDPPIVTTDPPISTTDAPVGTTDAPIVTTDSPVGTDAPPVARRLKYSGYEWTELDSFPYDIYTDYNGTGGILYASPVNEDEESFNPDASHVCYNYLDKFELSIIGVISLSEDICEFDQDTREAFKIATQETIKKELLESNLLGNVGLADIEVVLRRFCNENVRGRRLQAPAASSSWQIAYDVVLSNLLCGSSGCGSLANINAINALITSVADILTTHVQSGNFVSQLIQNPALAAIDDAILACLIAWGAVYASYNSAQITQTQGTANKASVVPEYYPDWTGLDVTCLNDGKEPPYMQKNPSIWLYDSLESCCARYYGGWNEPACLSSTGTGLWFVDYANLKCMTDCEKGSGSTCGGLAPPSLDELYADPRECCEKQLPWVYSEFCTSESLGNSCYVGTRKWYRGNENNGELCVQDCKKEANTSCGGLVDGDWVRLHDDASDCCDREFDWITNELCTKRSELDVLEMYWGDQSNGKCVKDSVTQATDLSVAVFESAEDCCKEKVHWVPLARCVAEADGLPFSQQGSDKYYVKGNKCVKDCETGVDCGGFIETWNPPFSSKTRCCNTLNVVLSECLN